MAASYDDHVAYPASYFLCCTWMMGWVLALAFFGYLVLLLYDWFRVMNWSYFMMWENF